MVKGHASTPQVQAPTNLTALNDLGLDVRVVGPHTGQASGLKMCYGGLTKGLNALATEILTAGQALGLEEALTAELRDSQAALFAWIDRQIPTMPAKSERWVGEMEEVASTFRVLGLPPQIHLGAAMLFQWIADVKPGGDLGPKASTWNSASEISSDLASKLDPKANL